VKKLDQLVVLFLQEEEETIEDLEASLLALHAITTLKLFQEIELMF